MNNSIAILPSLDGCVDALAIRVHSVCRPLRLSHNPTPPMSAIMQNMQLAPSVSTIAWMAALSMTTGDRAQASAWLVELISVMVLRTASTVEACPQDHLTRVPVQRPSTVGRS